MSPTVVSVDELDTEFISHPPRPLFPNVQDRIGSGIPIVTNDPLLSVYPPLADTNYTNYQFHQANKGQFPTPQTDFIWEIIGSFGSGKFLEISGFDIRVFAGTGRSLSNAIVTGNSFDSELILTAMQLSDDELHLFGWESGFGMHEWVLSAPHVFPLPGTTSDFQFPVDGSSCFDIKFRLNGTKMVITTLTNDVQIFSLPAPNSLSSTPILEQTFDPGFGISVSCEFSSDDMELLVVDFDNDTVNQWNLDSPLILPASFTSPDRVFAFNPNIVESLGNVRILKDSLSMYLMSIATQQISRYIFTDGFNQIPVVNKIPDEIFDVSSLDITPVSISLSKDNSLLWFFGDTGEILHELELPGIPLEYQVVSVNVSTGDYTIKVKVPVMEDSTFVQITVGDADATNNSTTLGTGNALTTFVTPLFTKDEDNFIADDQGKVFVEVT